MKKHLLCIVILVITIIVVFECKIVSVYGPSMLPTIKDGDVVIYMSSPNYNVGDIISFKRITGKKVVHRIVEKTKRKHDDTYLYITQGDNKKTNKTRDIIKVRDEDINGKVCIIIPTNVFSKE